MDSCSLPCSIVTIIIFIIVVVCLCLVGGAVLIMTGYTIDFAPYSSETTPGAVQTPVVIRPVLPTPQAVETPQEGDAPGLASPPEEREAVLPLVTSETLDALVNTDIPVNDLHELAVRLKGMADIPSALEPPLAPREVGEQKSFWVTNTSTSRKFQVSATLSYVTDHLYFWIEDGVEYDPDDLAALGEAFENEIYPTNREFFGGEWSPGIDGDPHLYVLYARGLGGNVAGYFSSADSYHPLAHPYSNGHEMFLLSADRLSLASPFTYGVLAHEFQHMIHWYRDRNETSWLNEGFSELAAFLNGYYVGGLDQRYVQNPDIQLNDWPNDSGSTAPHYGASFLFVLYFLDRFGEDATKSLVAEQANGLESIDIVLEQLGAADSISGAPVSADDVFSDWVVASYLQDDSIVDGRYTYSLYPDAPKPKATESIRRCPTETLTRDVRQYGVDYISVRCSGSYTLSFEGSISTRVLPTEPHSGSYYFWSNKGDESNMTLTRTFDFSQHRGPLTLTYWTWYDLEKDYDYLYLLASTDGERWEFVETPSGHTDNPSGNSYGWGYNGASGGGPVWIQESVDLSTYAGKVVQLRFEYVTDAAVHGEGFVLDSVAVPEIGYFTDFEEDDGGWETQGFARIQNILPQTYRISLISLGGSSTTVETYTLGPDAAIELPLDLRGDVDEIVLVVSGTTRFTREPAPYRFSIQP
jgi:immune inhibitor A